ncbi:MAG: hypothetical protein H0U54_04230 [Acidobacteria bacterium]|nr:hypothetical protein [Acidobacteriota bacterium]
MQNEEHSVFIRGKIVAVCEAMPREEISGYEERAKDDAFSACRSLIEKFNMKDF